MGSTHTIRVNVRLLAATNRDLGEMVAARTFRNDLFYRLRVFPIVMPPLRERQEDIPALVRYFVEKHARRMNCAGGNDSCRNAGPTRSVTPGPAHPGAGKPDQAGDHRLAGTGSLRVPLSEIKPPSEPAVDIRFLRAAERDHILKSPRRDGLGTGRAARSCRQAWRSEQTLQSKMRKLGGGQKSMSLRPFLCRYLQQPLVYRHAYTDIDPREISHLNCCNRWQYI